jgi:hypothetical protein
MATRTTGKHSSSSAKSRPTVLGRSPATGRVVLKPASKGGSISIRAAQAAARDVLDSYKI